MTLMTRQCIQGMQTSLRHPLRGWSRTPPPGVRYCEPSQARRRHPLRGEAENPHRGWSRISPKGGTHWQTDKLIHRQKGWSLYLAEAEVNMTRKNVWLGFFAPTDFDHTCLCKWTRIRFMSFIVMCSKFRLWDSSPGSAPNCVAQLKHWHHQ